MENLAKKIAKLEKDTPGVGETLWFITKQYLILLPLRTID